MTDYSIESHIFTTYDDISQTYPKHMINIHITYEKHIFLCSLIMFIICPHMFIICTRYLQTIICRRPYYIWVHMTYIWSTHEGSCGIGLVDYLICCMWLPTNRFNIWWTYAYTWLTYDLHMSYDPISCPLNWEH